MPSHYGYVIRRHKEHVLIVRCDCLPKHAPGRMLLHQACPWALWTSASFTCLVCRFIISRSVYLRYVDLVQSGRYANRQGHGSDAVMLEVRPNSIEAGVQLALQQLVHPQQKWDIRKDVQVQSASSGNGYQVRVHIEFSCLSAWDGLQGKPPEGLQNQLFCRNRYHIH